MFGLLIICLNTHLAEAFQDSIPQTPSQRVAVLAEALSADDAEVRRQAAYQLGELGVEASAAIEPLAKAADERSQEVRWYAVEALGKIGPPAHAAVPTILSGFNDDANDRFFRRSAIRSLGQIDAATEGVDAALSQASESDDIVLRVEAAVAAYLLKSDEKILSKFEELLAEDVDAQRAVCWHLGNSLANDLNDLNAKLCELAVSEVATVAAAARWSLSQRRVPAGQAILKKLDGDNPSVQLAYAKLLGQWLVAMKSKTAQDSEARRELADFVSADMVPNHLSLANNKSLQTALATNLAMAELLSVMQLTSHFPDANPVERAFTAQALSRIAEINLAEQPQADQAQAAAAVHAWITRVDFDEIPPPVWKLAAKLPTDALPAQILQQGVSSQNAVVRRYAAEILRRQM